MLLLPTQLASSSLYLRLCFLDIHRYRQHTTHLFSCAEGRTHITRLISPTDTSGVCCGCDWTVSIGALNPRRRLGVHTLKHFGHFVCVCGGVFDLRDTLNRHRRQGCRVWEERSEQWRDPDHSTFFVERRGWNALEAFPHQHFGTKFGRAQTEVVSICKREGVLSNYYRSHS